MVQVANPIPISSYKFTIKMLCKGIVTGGPTFLKATEGSLCTVGRLVLKVSLPSYWIFKRPSLVLGEYHEHINTLKLFAVNLPGASQYLLVCFVGGRVNSFYTVCSMYLPTSYLVIRKAEPEHAWQPLDSFIVLPSSFPPCDFRRQSQEMVSLIKGKSVKEFTKKDTPILAIV